MKGGGAAVRSRTRYTVVGYVAGSFGVSIATRNTTHVLAAAGRDIEVVGADSGGGDASPSAGERSRRSTITLFHMNPLEIAATAHTWRRAVDARAPRVCIPFWEMPLVPKVWEPLLRAMDAVLAPTRFVQEACARVVSPERLLHLPQAVFLPGGVAPTRARWGLRDDALVFVVAFDPGSDIARKNPWAAIDAFQRAFPREGDVQLVVKARAWPGVRAIEDELRVLRARAAGDRRIRVVEDSLSYEDALSLYASSDIMVSLHRSEGLGLHLMEAMSLGKVVVATAWSGNLDFTTEQNAVPISCRLVPVDPKHASYLAEVGRDGQVWAEVDVDEAAAALLALHRDRARRVALGEQAARDMEARRAAVLRGATFDELERRLARVAQRPRGFGSALARTRLSRLWILGRSLIGRVARVFRAPPG